MVPLRQAAGGRVDRKRRKVPRVAPLWQASCGRVRRAGRVRPAGRAHRLYEGWQGEDAEADDDEAAERGVEELVKDLARYGHT